MIAVFFPQYVHHFQTHNWQHPNWDANIELTINRILSPPTEIEETARDTQR